MSYICKKIGSSENSNFKEFICDARTDINLLPTTTKQGVYGEYCYFGSECLCLEDSSVWILGKDNNQWIELGV